MGRELLQFAAASAAALALVPSAVAMTDGGPGISLIWPAQGTITRGYGYDGGDWHPGIDIGTLRSLDVVAAGPGVVTVTGYASPLYDGYGQVVVVDMGFGIEALYAHLSSVGVHTGQSVTPGQKLGLAGCTGYCTGTHLHFELRDIGTAFDPAPLLPHVLAFGITP